MYGLTSIDMVLNTNGLTVPHNQLAFWLGAGGLIGVLLYYSLHVRFLVGALRLIRSPTTDARLAWDFIGLVAAVAAGLLFTLTTTLYTAVSYNVFLGAAFYFTTGMVALKAPFRSPEQSLPRGRVPEPSR